jgi:hypothetical protein
MNLRFLYRHSVFRTGLAFFLGAIQLAVMVHVELTAEANGYSASTAWLLLIALVFGFVLHHGYRFFDGLR